MTRKSEQIGHLRAPPRGLVTQSRFINRELSWLDFNERVLALAADPGLPLLERVKYLAIFSQNLDEFFQVRVAGLKTQVEAGVDAISPDGRSAPEQLRDIRTRTLELVGAEQELFHKELVPELGEAGISICDWGSLEESDMAHLHHVFRTQLFPVLTPLSVDPAHPFPYISNLSLNLAVVMFDPQSAGHRFARVKVPPRLPRLLALPDRERFIPIEQAIAAFLPELFPGMEVLSHTVFRVTRDAELAVEEAEADDLLMAIETGLRRRRRTNAVSRLETDGHMSGHLRRLLTAELELEPDDIYDVRGLLDLGNLWALYDLDRPDLKQATWLPQTPPRLQPAREHGRGSDIFEALREGDVLVHHPYDSFRSSVQAFLEQASADPQVLAIKHTLYRTSGSDDSIVRTLARAAEEGKQVVTLVELKARFDEKANIEWARKLEESGVHVVYGVVGLKTHAKIALVVRDEGDTIRRYCHVGTGNYNPETANLYEDMGILSADFELGADLGEFFNYLTGCSRPKTFSRLLFAPASLRPAILELIREEMDAPDGHIVLKMNSLADPEIIDALYEASGAGCRIDLIVRGICCLRPGVVGLSETIRVRSILGRFLEHSRVFRFGSATRGYRTYIGSADLMPRNLDRRVEAVLPVTDRESQERIDEVLDACLSGAGAWLLGSDGRWRRARETGAAPAQASLQERARERSLSEREPHP